MRLRWRHGWNLTPAQALAIQLRGAGRLSRKTDISIPSFRGHGRIAAVDVGYDSGSDTCFAALVLWDIAAGCAVGEWTRSAPSTFPYVPGLLSFREIPPLIPLFRRLRSDFDLILCDGQGLAHPRRFGLACHLGVLYDRPSIGWAKSRLIGEHPEPGIEQGAAARLIDRGEQVGWALRSRRACRPTFVSPGHRLSVKSSLMIARSLLGRHRLCEPARRAHHLTRIAMCDG